MIMINVLEQSVLNGIQLRAVRAFKDNYIWIAHNNQQALVVDPGQASPVLHYLQKHSLDLLAILITHHHADHVGGIEALKEHYPQATVYGPAKENIPHCNYLLHGEETIQFPELDLRFTVLDVPGHTAGHIAYFAYSPEKEPFVFCGDTLFSIGCGRLFEGTAQQMVQSLAKLAALPADTLVCCAHEYTLSNIEWALAVDPKNTALNQYHEQVRSLRQQELPTVPSTIALELAANPFLRTQDAHVIAAANQYTGQPLARTDEVFAALREWKNNF